MMLQVSWGLAMMGVMMHVVTLVVIVCRNYRVIVVIVGHDHPAILTMRWATIASGIVTIPHIDSLVVGIWITPSGCPIINLHLPSDRGR